MSETVVTPSKNRFRRWVDNDVFRFVRVLGYAKKYWLAMTIGLLLVGVDIYFELYIANAQKVFIDNINDKNLDGITAFIKQSLLVVAGVVVLVAVQGLLKGLVQQYMIRDMAVHLFSRINWMPLKRLQSMHSADLVSRVTRDVPEAASIGNAVFDLSKDMLLIIFSFLYLSSFNVYLALVALLSGPLIFTIGRLFDRTIRTLSQRIQKREADARESLQEIFQGMPVIRAYGLNEMFEQSFLEKKKQQNKDMLKRDMVTTTMYQLMDLIINAIIISVVYFVCLAVLRGEMTVGTILSFIYLLIRIQVPFSNISRTLSHIQQGLGASDRVHTLIGWENELPKQAEGMPVKLKPDTEWSVLSLNDVSFSYRDEEGNERRVLHEIQFSIKPGETVAIVGMSGSGKSTLAKLCCGLLEPDDGSIHINGKLVSGGLDEAWSKVGYVPQTSFMFTGTIRDNITIGLSGVTEKQLIWAAEMAGVEHFIGKLSDGYNTPLSEASSTLSGGEVQRLAIARAILRDTKLLIMDESTSALDNEMENYLEKSLQKLSKDRAMIMIAHRMNTIRNADRIVVMDKGTIIAEGKHDELLQECELYEKLCRSEVAL